MRRPPTNDQRVDQTLFVSTPGRLGNCVAACVATYLGRQLRDVPHFLEAGRNIHADEHGDVPDRVGWWAMLLGYMAGVGLWPLGLADVTEAEPDELVFVAGMSERGVLHQVLYLNGALWHDPHPSRAGVLDVQEVLAWRPVAHNHDPGTAWPTS